MIPFAEFAKIGEEDLSANFWREHPVNIKKNAKN
jgi:hypothetical protein